MAHKNIPTKEDLKQKLSPLQYQVSQEKATERPFTGIYNSHKEKGIYSCICCEAPLFQWDTKFESGCGWPSFFQPISPEAVKEVLDKSYGMMRLEVVCGNCGAHLGHVFDDGPNPTKQRYCMNSASLNFEKKEE